MLYAVDVPITGVKFFLILTVVVFDIIELSVSSINPINFENLKTLSNFCKLVVL